MIEPQAMLGSLRKGTFARHRRWSQKCRLCSLIAPRSSREEAYPKGSSCLLRARRERSRGSRPAEQRDELAPCRVDHGSRPEPVEPAYSSLRLPGKHRQSGSSPPFDYDPRDVEFNWSVQYQLQSIGRGFEGQGLSRALIEPQSLTLNQYFSPKCSIFCKHNRP